MRNVVKADEDSGPLLLLHNASGSRVTGNRFYDERSADNPAMVVVVDASRNVLAHNRFSTAADSAPRISLQGASVENALRPNTFRHR
jgi:nitrous oxidase accessory protein NosD